MSPLLSVQGVSQCYGSFKALDGVSFDLHPGDTVSLVGPNGAGKTTMINTLTALALPTSGRVLFDGKDISRIGKSRLPASGLARSFQLVSVFPTLKVREMISLAVWSRLSLGYSCVVGPRHRARVQARALELAEIFGLQHRLDMVCAQLSQGEKKLLDIASALALEPKVMLLDEPTSGVASADKHPIMRTLVKATRQQGVQTLLLVEHDMDLVAEYSTRVLALKAGQLLADTDPKSFFADAALLDTFIGRLPDHARHIQA